MSDVPDGTYRAVVDRIEDGLAALELTPASADSDADAPTDSRVPKWELLVDPAELPPSGRRADAVLSVVVEDGSLASATHDPAATGERAETARDRFDRLSERPSSGDDATESSDE